MNLFWLSFDKKIASMDEMGQDAKWKFQSAFEASS